MPLSAVCLQIAQQLEQSNTLTQPCALQARWTLDPWARLRTALLRTAAHGTLLQVCIFSRRKASEAAIKVGSLGAQQQPRC